jgi:hypothetical protein
MERATAQLSPISAYAVTAFIYEPDRHAVQSWAAACFEQPGRMMRWEARIYWSDEMFRISRLEPQVDPVLSETFSGVNSPLSGINIGIFREFVVRPSGLYGDIPLNTADLSLTGFQAVAT